MDLPTPKPLLPASASELLRNYARASRSPNTLRTYASQWRAFEGWCAAHGCHSLPAHPLTVATYLAQRAQAGATVATAEVALATIAFVHSASAAPFDRSHPELNAVVAGIRRVHARSQKQAAPLTGSLLRQMLNGMGQSPTELRDSALLTILYSLALRPAEAAGLDWMRLGGGRGWLSVTADAVQLVLIGSKTSQAGKQMVAIPTPASRRTVRALRRWVQHARVEPGEPLFRALTKAGQARQQRLHAGSISVIVRQALTRHFVRGGCADGEARAQARRFSGHSGRIGFYVAAAQAGAPPQHIAAVARHRGLGMGRRYTQQADLLKCAPHQRRGVGV